MSQAAIISRFVKASMLEVLGEDYMRTARAKGLGERMLVARHALRNALVPLATVVGLEFGRLLGGAVIVESVFAWPGMGRLMVQAIGNRDYTVVQGTLLVLVLVFVLVNLLTRSVVRGDRPAHSPGWCCRAVTPRFHWRARPGLSPATGATRCRAHGRLAGIAAWSVPASHSR